MQNESSVFTLFPFCCKDLKYFKLVHVIKQHRHTNKGSRGGYGLLNIGNLLYPLFDHHSLHVPSAHAWPIIVHRKVEGMNCFSSVTFPDDIYISPKIIHFQREHMHMTMKKVILWSPKLIQAKVHLRPLPSIKPFQFLGASYTTVSLTNWIVWQIKYWSFISQLLS